MGRSFDGEPPAPASPQDRLDSWKEIATYLNRDVTTVQRWEKREAMPVHRHQHDRMGSVYAFRTELDGWVRGRNPGGAPEAEPAPAPAAAEPSVGLRTFNVRSRSILVLSVIAVVAAALAIGGGVWLRTTEFFWRNPIADARFQRVTDFEGTEQAGAVSRDGRLVAFLSDRDGRMDVWITQLGSGVFHNLTRGIVPELVNPSVRLLGFSPDGLLVTFWARTPDRSAGDAIDIWSVSTLGGEPRRLFEGVAEADWSSDGTRLVYHTPGPGDPMFVTDSSRRSEGTRIFTAAAGLHGHYPLWASDGTAIYFVSGNLPDQLDIWRIPSQGGSAERITSHNGRVSHPVLLTPRTLAYLATDPDGSGPRLHSIDVERRIPHRLSSGLDQYTSLAATPDGRRLVATLDSPKRTLWRLPIADAPASVSAASRIALTSGTGFAPRLGPGYLLYVSATGTTESLWKLADGKAIELWTRPDARIVGGPAIAPDGRHIAFSIREAGKTFLYVMRADGTAARIVADSLELNGAPAWAPDGLSIAIAAIDRGAPRLYRVPLDGGRPSLLVDQHSTDPAWAPDGRFLVYSGPDVGTTFPVSAVTTDARPHPFPPLTLTRGARHLTFLAGRRTLVFLRGEIQHKNLWILDLDTGAERQLTDVSPEFTIRDFDVSPDGREIVLERVQQQSDIVMLDLPQR